MECKCNGNFWIGLGLGAVLGVVAGFVANSDKTKAMRKKMCCAAHAAAEKAGEFMTKAQECAMEVEE
ncbi:MAG: hypothetical protein IKY99_01280 [Bacteroidaceae bacterium]|nr:hypothetical protein [Bacteroidaceae bacterium]MBR5612436.1 hypothetical protein [Bacteroidaceae bacterium]